MRVKIIGAGSIGNHLAQASRRMGWEVAVVDNDPKALVRMREEIYPSRYGAWDDEIQLFISGEEPKNGFDIIMIGTPPDVRMKVATEALKEKPRLLHLEKPLCTPNLQGLEEFQKAMSRNLGTIVTVGYNHAISKSMSEVVNILNQGVLGEIITLDVEFREHWGGIFKAHPWLSGPQESYLGYWQRGGGAGGEHSHALHLWIYLAHVIYWGDINEMKAMLDFHVDHGSLYDRVASFTLQSRYGRIGRVLQDVVTYPAKKWARLQGDNGFIEWHCNGVPEGDLVRYQITKGEVLEKIFSKNRSDDFYQEMQHYEKLLAGEVDLRDSPLDLNFGLEVMRILHDAYSHYFMM